MKSVINNKINKNIKKMSKFHHLHTFEKRKEEAERILKKYPDRIPIIVQNIENNDNLPNIDKNKYLVPKDLLLGQFIYVIRKKINVPSEKAIFAYVNNTLHASSTPLIQIYEKNKDDDQFLYFFLSGESTFG